VAFVFDKNTFARKGSFPYPYEGWGLAKHKENGLLTTDGTNILRFWAKNPPIPAKDGKKEKEKDGWWKETSAKPLQTADGRPVKTILWRQANGERVQLAVRLNELENVGGEVWANLWPTETIVRIDPESAVIKGWIDMRGLRDEAEELARSKGGQIDVLNGIAYRAATASEPQTLVVTGKWWPRAYQVEIVASEQDSTAAAVAAAMDIEATCAWKGFPVGQSGVGEVTAALPSTMYDFQEIDFGM